MRGDASAGRSGRGRDSRRSPPTPVFRAGRAVRIATVTRAAVWPVSIVQVDKCADDNRSAIMVARHLPKRRSRRLRQEDVGGSFRETTRREN